MQAVLRIEELPEAPLDSSAAFYANHLNAASAALDGDADSLAIVLPPSGSDHDDWRRALARDLGRKFAPKRVAILGGGSAKAVDAMLVYLRGAPGVTGQYLPLHD